MKSIPVAAKVGSAGILGGGGITGAGLLIHHKLQFHPTGLDKLLIEEEKAYLEVKTVSSNEDFAVPNGTTQNEVSLTVKASSKESQTKFSTDTKWNCTIKGVAKNKNNTSVTLTANTTFDKTTESPKFKNKLGENNKKHKSGLVTSCARNRGSNPTEDSNWESTLILKLEENGGKWIFNQKDVDAVFDGTYINPKE